MKLTNNHKILLGLAIGGGIAWWLTRKKSASTTSAPSTANAEELTREEKINYILENIETNAVEESTGFSGERFEYDPRLGYALPIGTIDVQSAGKEMILPREGNLAQEVFFNADGEATNNPVEEAEAILDALTDEELNVAFKVSRARVNNPNLTDDELVKIANIDKKGQGLFLGLIKEKFNDVKALTKNPNWKKGLKRRIEMLGMSKEERKEFRQSKREQRAENRKDKMSKRPARAKFEDEVINRNSGAMWGGYRNDGKPTNADAVILTRGNKPNQRGRG
jgi:hypothetical protein